MKPLPGRNVVVLVGILLGEGYESLPPKFEYRMDAKPAEGWGR